MKKVKINRAGGLDSIAYFRKAWNYKSLIRILVKRDLKIYYSQTFLGIFWAILQPMVAVLIYTLFFYYFIGIKSGNIPYTIFVLTGIIAWFSFTDIIYNTGTALRQNQDLIKKIDFPKINLLISKVVFSFHQVVVSFFLLAFFMLVYKITPGIQIVFFPLFFLLNIFCGLSVAIWLSALTIRYRDLHHIIPYLISFGIWITPVFYPTTILPLKYEKFLFMNPIAGIISGYRWTLLNQPAPDLASYLVYPVVFILLLLGLRYFRKIEGEIVDYI